MLLFKQQVSADSKYSFANQANCVIFDAHNDTPYNVGVSFGRDTGPDNADYYTTPHSILYGISPVGNAPSINGARWTGTIYIYTETPLGTGTTDLATAPAFQVTIIGYPAGYQPRGTTSMSRMTSTPNTVSTNVSSTNSIVNTNNAPGSTWVDVQPTDASNPTFSADNSGNWTVKGDNAGTLTTLLQLIAGASPAVKLAANGVITEVLGSLTADSCSSVQTGVNGNIAFLIGTGFDTQKGLVVFAVDNTQTANLIEAQNSSFATVFGVSPAGNLAGGTLNGAYIDNNAGGSKVRLGSSAANAGDILDATTTDTYLKAANGKFIFQSPNGTQKAQFTAFNFGQASGISGVTVTHGLGGTPSAVLVVPIVAQPGSATVGVGNVGSTTFEATCGAGTGFYWFAVR